MPRRSVDPSGATSILNRSLLTELRLIVLGSVYRQVAPDGAALCCPSRVVGRTLDVER